MERFRWNKVSFALAVFWAASLVFAAVSPAGAGYAFLGTEPADMEYARSWSREAFGGAESLPISFEYGGEKITGIPAAWNPASTYQRIDANLVYKAFEGKDPATGLAVKVEVWEYQDYPVVEWLVWFANDGDQPTPVLKSVLPVDLTFRSDGTKVLHHNSGDFYSEAGYTPLETPIGSWDIRRFAPAGGRSSNRAFPYFRLEFEDRGVTLAVGWPGQWFASFAGSEEGVRVTAGQEYFEAYLLPGEKIRTPRITVMSWTGDVSRSVNLWRRWYLDHVLPKPDGKPLAPLLATAATDAGEEFTGATEENQLRYMEVLKRAGIDYDVWLIDAGWYPSRNEQGERTWYHVGTWEPEADRFPDGFVRLADLGRQYGSRLWIWFEPERVYAGSRIDRERPECLLRLKGPFGSESPDRLFDFGNAECRAWMTDLISGVVAQNGIGIYRHDFNIDPLRYWLGNDGPDRRGMTENLYVQGILEYFDELLRRNPGLVIDNCASGGRRNDLEMMRRSVPLHYSDFGYGNHGVKLAFHHSLFSWLPYFKDATISWDGISPSVVPDRFAVYGGMAPMMIYVNRGLGPASNLERLLIRIWREAAEFMLYGDYYPLTPLSRDNKSWVVRQFNAPEKGSGIVQAFRHVAAPESSVTVQLENLDPESTYLVANYESGERFHASGDALMNVGITLELRPRAAGVWFYREISNSSSG